MCSSARIAGILYGIVNCVFLNELHSQFFFSTKLKLPHRFDADLGDNHMYVYSRMPSKLFDINKCHARLADLMNR